MSKNNIPTLKWTKDGLIPTIVQDVTTNQVLMMAWMNQTALQKTLKTGEAWFWSRSRQTLWHKGATSGNIQKIINLHYDCDGDTILAKVHPTGPACHTGQQSCFFNKITLTVNSE